MGQMGYSGSDRSLRINKTVTFYGHAAILAFYFYEIGKRSHPLMSVFSGIGNCGGFYVQSVTAYTQVLSIGNVGLG